jgi:hypothetical protein
MDVSATMKAVAIVAPDGTAMPIPEHKLMFLATDSADEAHYVAAVLNCDLVSTVIAGYAVDNHISTHPIENIVIPQFDPLDKRHVRLAEFSRAAHAAAAGADESARSRPNARSIVLSQAFGPLRDRRSSSRGLSRRLVPSERPVYTSCRPAPRRSSR